MSGSQLRTIFEFFILQLNISWLKYDVLSGSELLSRLMSLYYLEYMIAHCRALDVRQSVVEIAYMLF